MSKQIELTASDGHKLDAYVAEPQTSTGAGLVVIQEIFGINPHIRSVAERFADQGYLSIAPALFDRAERRVQLAYDEGGFKKGYALVQQIKPEATVLDIEASMSWLRSNGAKKVGVVGYCWGGTMAWLANTRLEPDATVSYYGGQLKPYLHEKAHAPAIFHFGKQDDHIPPSIWEEIHTAHPNAPVYLYDAGHGFNRDVGSSYNADAARLALERTLDFFKQHLQPSSN